jgi:flagellar hook-length control protein FliK
MMVSAASSANTTASPASAIAAPQNPAPGATADVGSAPTSPAPASAAPSTATPASTAAQAGAQTTASADTAATPRLPGTDTIPRFSDMLRAANDEDDADGSAPAKPAAGPATDAADASKDDTHSDAAASTALALAMWPGMAAPVTTVPNGAVLTAQPSSPGRAGRSAAVSDADAAPAADVESGAAPLSAGKPSGAAVGVQPDSNTPDTGGAVGADTNAPTKRAIGFRPAMDDASASPDTSRASARSETADTAAPRERVAANAALPTPNANTMPNAAGWSTPVNAASATDTPTVTVKLPPQSPDQWNQPLTDALGDRLQVQLGRGSEQAVIRLDPPMLGSIEISIRHEAGSLQVQLSASNGDVLRQLHGIGDTLRQDLAQRQTGDVSVVVSDSSRDASGADSQRGRGRQRDAQTADDGPGRALAEAETDPARTSFSFARERE